MPDRRLRTTLTGSARTAATIAVLSAACSCHAPPPTAGVAVPQPDYWPTTAWRTTAPEEQGVDSKQLASMLAEIRDEGHDIDAVLVVRNGYLVLEQYVFPFPAHHRHMIHSCTKSITSALIGIAIGEGAISGPEQPVLSFFPERQVVNRDRRKEEMSLENLLTMTTGLDCHDNFRYQFRGIGEMQASDDWVQHVLDLPMKDKPGTRFEYCNQASFLLSAVLQQTTGVTAEDYAQLHLLTPLDISDLRWPASPGGVSWGWDGIEMLPTDMAKIGFLYLHRGGWGGAQLVPDTWVDASTRAHVQGDMLDSYGYQWWVDTPGLLARLGLSEEPPLFTALGYAGQYIAVVPSRNLVVVFVGGIDERIPLKLLRKRIIPAAFSREPLPPNPEGTALLSSTQQELASPGAAHPIPPMPDIARLISGKTIRLRENGFRMKSASLIFRKDEALLELTIGGHTAVNTIGLDGIYRLTETTRGTVACRGTWESDDTFALSRIFLGESQRWTTRFTFTGNEVTLRVIGSLSGELPQLTGTIEPNKGT